MKKNKIKPITTISLFILAIVAGIILPVFFFTRYILIFQIICSLLFIIPIVYSKYRSDIKTFQMLDKILYLSRHDDLTNTYNRRHFEELFLNPMEETIDSSEKFSLIYLDIDNLKTINDNLGHHVGDQAILTFSKVIKHNIRETDLLARYGGDEFIVVLFNRGTQLIENRIKNIGKQLEENPIYYNGEKVIIKFSYGISNFPEDTNEFLELIKIADKRMYLNKKGLDNWG